MPISCRSNLSFFSFFQLITSAREKRKSLFVWKEMKLGIVSFPGTEIWDENKQTAERQTTQLTKSNAAASFWAGIELKLQKKPAVILKFSFNFW